MPVLDAVLERFMAAGPDLADQDLAAIYELTTLRGLNRRRAALSSASSGTAATVEVRAAEVVARAIARACGTRASGDRWCLRRPLGPDLDARIRGGDGLARPEGRTVHGVGVCRRAIRFRA